MATTLLERAERTLRKRSQSVWNNYVGGSRLREGVAWGIAAVASVSAVIAISLAARYAGSIAYVQTTNTIDRYGQVLDRRAAMNRTTLDSEARGVIDNFIPAVFQIRASKQSMEDNATLAQSLMCAPTARVPVIGYWQTHSPLGSDGSWRPVMTEQNVKITSVLKRPTNAFEYLVEFTLTSVDVQSEVPSVSQLYRADIALEQRLAPTDTNLGGFCATHFDFSEMK